MIATGFWGLQGSCSRHQPKIGFKVQGLGKFRDSAYPTFPKSQNPKPYATEEQPSTFQAHKHGARTPGSSVIIGIQLTKLPSRIFESEADAPSGCWRLPLLCMLQSHVGMIC